MMAAKPMYCGCLTRAYGPTGGRAPERRHAWMIGWHDAPRLLAGRRSRGHGRLRTAHPLAILAVHLVVPAAGLVRLLMHLPHVCAHAHPHAARRCGSRAFGRAACAFGLPAGFFAPGAEAPSG